jgi:hypothetical protein
MGVQVVIDQDEVAFVIAQEWLQTAMHYGVLDFFVAVDKPIAQTSSGSQARSQRFRQHPKFTGFIKSTVIRLGWCFTGSLDEVTIDVAGNIDSVQPIFGV